MRKRKNFNGITEALVLAVVLGSVGWGGAEAWAGSLNDIRKEVRKKKKEEVEEKEEERTPPPAEFTITGPLIIMGITRITAGALIAPDTAGISQ